MENYKAKLEIDNDGAWLHVDGSIDFYNAQNFKALLEKTLADGQLRLGLDFSELRLIDSSGLTVLLGAQKRFDAKGGELILCSLKDNVHQIFTLTRIVYLFKVFNDKPAGQHYFKTGESE